MFICTKTGGVYIHKDILHKRQCLRNSAIQTSSQNFSPGLWALFVCNRVGLFRYFLQRKFLGSALRAQVSTVVLENDPKRV